jgi:hypothetical protein
MILHVAVAVFVILLLYYWMNMKPKNFPPGKLEENVFPIIDSSCPSGGGLDYLHRGPASHKRRQKGNPVPRRYNWAILFLEAVNTGT